MMQDNTADTDRARAGGQKRENPDTEVHTGMDIQHAGEMELQLKASFSIKDARTTDYPTGKKQRARPSPHTRHKSLFER